jgi:hypothetical protein
MERSPLAVPDFRLSIWTFVRMALGESSVCLRPKFAWLRSCGECQLVCRDVGWRGNIFCRFCYGPSNLPLRCV